MAEQDRDNTAATFGQAESESEFGQPAEIKAQGGGEERSSLGQGGSFGERERYRSEGQGRRHLREQASVVREDVRELAYAAGDAAREQLDPLEEYVREKPMKALLIAAGVGALIGMVFLRR